MRNIGPGRRQKLASIEWIRTTDDAALGGHAQHRAAMIALEVATTGQIVWPWTAGYEADRMETNPLYDEFPLCIVYCETAADVAESLRFSEGCDVHFVCRSSGHSTAGYSVMSGRVVIDTSKLADISVNIATMTVHVGPGVAFGRLNAVLDSHRVHVPGGACSGVCVAGYMTGGGYGYTSRHFGMNCDLVVQVEMMLFDGSVVVASPSSNTALFWAVRGGTGGNFGVLLGITYRLHPLDAIFGWVVQWDLSDGVEGLRVLQGQYMAGVTDSRVGWMGNICTNPSGQMKLIAQGMFVGSEAEGMAALAPMLASGGTLTHHTTATYGKLDEWLDLMPFPIPNPPDGSAEAKRSLYIGRDLDDLELGQIVSYYQRATTAELTANTLVIEPYGGRIATPQDNAFIHRDVTMDIFLDAFWVPGDAAHEAASLEWINGYMGVLEPLGNGRAYQNYPWREITDWSEKWWGPAFPKLWAVSQKYDPDGRFTFPQAVNAAPAPAAGQQVSLGEEIQVQRRLP